MSVLLDVTRAKLVIKILYADSTEAVERHIEIAIQALKKRKINGYIITRFIAKIIYQFEVITRSASPIQMSNMNAARDYFNRLTEPTAITLQ